MDKKPKTKDARPARVIASQSPPTKSQPPRYIRPGDDNPKPQDVETETEESGDVA